MNLAQIVTSLVLLAVIGGSAYVMNIFFGIVGVGLLLAFLVPILAFVFWLGRRGQSGGSNTGQYRRESKGARQED